MAVIGTFTKRDEAFTGNIGTLTINAKVNIVPEPQKHNELAPDYRIYAGKVEFGAGWKRVTRDGDGREYISIKLDDPSFTAPIQCNLVAAPEDGYTLYWSR